MSVFGNPKHPSIQSLLRFNSYLSLHPAAITLQRRPDVQPICTDRAVLGVQRGLNWSAAISNCCPEQQPPHLRIPPQSLPRNLPQIQPLRLTWPVIIRTGQCCPLPVWTPELPTFPRVTPLSMLLPPPGKSFSFLCLWLHFPNPSKPDSGPLLHETLSSYSRLVPSLGPTNSSSLLSVISCLLMLSESCWCGVCHYT